jgi:hypothetical protein
MIELYRQALELIEADATWLDDSVRHCQEVQLKLAEPEKSKLGLLCAVGKERAQIHRELAAKMREQLH